MVVGQRRHQGKKGGSREGEEERREKHNIGSGNCKSKPPIHHTIDAWISGLRVHGHFCSSLNCQHCKPVSYLKGTECPESLSASSWSLGRKMMSLFFFLLYYIVDFLLLCYYSDGMRLIELCTKVLRVFKTVELIGRKLSKLMEAYLKL